MVVDASKLKRRLPAPPADGNPAMDRPEAARVVAVPGNLPRLDGRSLRATGRTVQLNLKVSPEVKARFLALAESEGRLMADLFEDAVTALEEKAPAR